MQGSLDIHLLAALRASLDHFQVAGDGPSFMVVHLTGTFVADPRVGTSSTRVDPEDVPETKIILERGIHDLDGHGDEGPASTADVGLGATGPDLIIVRQIDIEDQFLAERTEIARLAQRLAIAWIGGVDGTNLESRGVETKDFFAQANT